MIVGLSQEEVTLQVELFLKLGYVTERWNDEKGEHEYKLTPKGREYALAMTQGGVV